MDLFKDSKYLVKSIVSPAFAAGVGTLAIASAITPYIKNGIKSASSLLYSSSKGNDYKDYIHSAKYGIEDYERALEEMYREKKIAEEEVQELRERLLSLEQRINGTLHQQG